MITILRQGKNYIEGSEGVYTEYACSGAADLASLPTGKDSERCDRPRPGSTAVVPSSDKAGASVYILSNEHEWIVLVSD